MLRAGACQSTLSTKSPLASLIVNGADAAGGLHAAVAAGAVEAAVGGGGEHLLTPLDGDPVEGGLGALVAGRLTQPVEGQADRDEHDGAEAEGQVAG